MGTRNPQGSAACRITTTETTRLLPGGNLAVLAVRPWQLRHGYNVAVGLPLWRLSDRDHDPASLVTAWVIMRAIARQRQISSLGVGWCWTLAPGFRATAYVPRRKETEDGLG
ncbi:hypothetical protein NDU88_004274 [Pleurodeles waltl]|uniref:Uncharacterized protein n=1 Tax=Pleurodeles waltl TaxID=8319 RepID=A0AAV7TQU1_PLEWA|nr:hypothetical protein NDU88_004274 [Pleurodeles waltl]